MKYAAAVEPGTERTAWGAVLPDLPGCFSAGDTLEEALIRAKEAAQDWISEAKKEGEPVPEPSAVEDLLGTGEFEGWQWAWVDVDTSRVE